MEKLMCTICLICVMALAGATANADLVSHWKFDETSGTTATDSAGSNNGTVYGGAIWTTGKIDGALGFDGDDDYVYVGDKDNLDFAADDSFTIATWIKTPVDGVMVDKRRDSAGGFQEGYYFQVWAGKTLYFQIEDTGNLSSKVIGSTDIIDNKWHHVAAVRDAAEDKLYVYVDGVSDATPVADTTVSTLATTKAFEIGRHEKYPASFFLGKIDDMRVYDRALSAEEVRELYRGKLVGLEIVGPDEVAENFQAQYKAIAVYYNNSTEDVTDSAEWLVEPNDIASIVAGLLTTEPIDLPLDLTITARYTDVNTVEAQKIVSVFAICPSGSALEFDGINDYVRVNDSPTLDGMSELTIVSWIYLSSTNKGGTIIKKTPNYQIAVADSTRKLRVGIHNGFNWIGFSGSWLDTGLIVSAGTWHHVAMVWNGSTLTPYLDAVDGISFMGSGSINDNSSAVLIGLDNEADYFNGTIDEVAIYDKALSAEEIQALMHSRPDTDEPNLVAYWDFDEGEGQIVYDLSLNDNHGRLGSDTNADDNDPAWVDSDAPVGICTPEGLFERNISEAVDMKLGILEILEEALDKERAGQYILEQFLTNGDFSVWNKGDILASKRMIRSAVQDEEKVETAVGQSIEKLDDALDALGQE